MNRRSFLKLLPKLSFVGALSGKGIIDEVIEDEEPIVSSPPIFVSQIKPDPVFHPMTYTTSSSMSFPVPIASCSSVAYTYCFPDDFVKMILED